MRVGVIGAGMISEIYLKNMIYRFDNLEVIAIASLHGTNAAKRAEQFGITACSVDELIADPQIEMVVVLTPVGSHYELIKKALLAGKHVYTEKTLTDNSETAKELLDLAKEKKVYLGSAPDTFMGSAFEAAKEAIDSGRLGTIHSFMISVNRNNDLLQTYYPFLREPGAGCLFDYGVYQLTVLTSLLGEVSKVGSIVGTPYKKHINIDPKSPIYGTEMDTPNESQVSAVIQMKNGIIGTFHMDHDSNTCDESLFVIYGTKGILYLPDTNAFGGEVRFLENRLDWTPVEPVALEQTSSYSDNCRGIGPSDMAAAIEKGIPNRASGKGAYHVLKVLEAMLSCGEEGKFVSIEA